jgi:hypothetical protein
MEGLGLRQLEVVGNTLRPAKARPGNALPLVVPLPEGYRGALEVLEEELALRVARLAAAGLMPSTDSRFVTADALHEAGARARPPRGLGPAPSADPLRAHGQAVLLLQAIELLETQGARLAADFLSRMGSDGGQPRAERALGASAGVAQAARVAEALAGATAPKASRLRTVVREARQARPGGRIVVVAKYRETAEDLARLLASPPPLGVGGPVSRGLDPEATLLVVTSAAADPASLARADLVVYHDVASAAERPRGASAGASLVLVAEGGREQAAWDGREPPLGHAGRGLAAPRPPPSGSQVLIDEFTSSRGPHTRGKGP